MGKLISFGEYNNLYKYIWIYLSIAFVFTFVFDYELIFDQLQNEPLKIPTSPFIFISFDYIGFIIISLIIKVIEKFIQKKQNVQYLTEEEKLIFNEIDIDEKYGLEKGDYFLYINLFFVVATDIFAQIIFQFKNTLMNYWMFEMLFFALFNSRFLKTKLYKHHICSFIFILSSCSIIKTIVIVLSFINNTNDVEIFKNRNWLIPLSIIVYFLFHIFRAYIYCNEKYYLEKKIISITNYILIYGIFGLIASSICAVISTFYSCGDNTIPELLKIVCSTKDKEDIYYFDNYIIYFRELASEFLELRIILIIIKTIIYYAYIYYIYVIYKKLSPIYNICLYRFNNLIIDILLLINDLFNNNIQYIDFIISIFNILILIFYISGSFVYLEFVELNFCNLNFYTRKNVNRRAHDELKISGDNYNADSSVSEGFFNDE